MRKKYIIGIDGGSQSTKVLIYDLEGNVVCEDQENLRPMYIAEPGIVEHPDDDLWETLKVASQKVMAKFKGDHKDIIGIGLGSIRCCKAYLKADGTLAQQIISWMDRRSSEPYEHLNNEVAYVTTPSGYLIHRLTGKFNDNAGNYYGPWPMDYTTWQWSKDEKAYRKYNLSRQMLFDVHLPDTILGYVTTDAAKATGYPTGIPVVGATSDKAVEALGAGLIDENCAVVSLGTYITLMVGARELPRNPLAYWAIMSSIPYKYLLECYGIRRGMWTVTWIKELLGDSLIKRAEELNLSPEDYLNREAQSVPPGCSGLMTVLDWLANPWEPFKRGIMIGFDVNMTPAYMYRSILESIAMTMKNNYEAMCEEAGGGVKEIIISGGGSNSDLFMQIFADVFNMPARRNVVNGSASIGAAINTAVAVGAYDNYEQAVRAMVRIRDTFRPIAENAEKYQAINNGVFKDLTKHTDLVLKNSYSVFHPDKVDNSFIAGWSQT